MKAIVNMDKRSDADKKYDAMYNKMVRGARLNPMQSNVVARYLRELIGIRMNEIQSAVDMSWLLALIESENFGTDVSKGATRLLRVQAHAADVRNEAYGKGGINANGVYDEYDGCGIEHLKVRLARYGVEYDTNL